MVDAQRIITITGRSSQRGRVVGWSSGANGCAASVNRRATLQCGELLNSMSEHQGRELAARVTEPPREHVPLTMHHTSHTKSSERCCGYEQLIQSPRITIDKLISRKNEVRSSSCFTIHDIVGAHLEAMLRSLLTSKVESIYASWQHPRL